jgi:hypothetical protein
VCHQASRRGGLLWCETRGDRVIMAGDSIVYAAGELVFPWAEGPGR